MDSSLSLDEVGIAWRGSPRLWDTIPLSSLPVCCIRGIVRDASGTILFSLRAHAPLGKGSYGSIDAFYKKVGQEETLVAVKRPRGSESILTEALVQWYLGRRLSSYGIPSCIPRVHDIFLYKPTQTIWFTMDIFNPTLFSNWCVKRIPTNPQIFPQIMVQLAILLEVFQKDALVDHRDLKVNNMLIVEEETKFPITWESQDRILTFPFRIIIIDFGFACINNTVDVKDGLPALDVCPKEGRDMFQLLVSMWNIGSIRHSLEPRWGNWVRGALRSANGDSSAYVRLTEGALPITWMYSVTRGPQFTAPHCSSKYILHECMKYIDGD